MSEIRMNLQLGGAGWAALEISDGETQHEIKPISYLSDVLDDLLRVGLDIAADGGYGLAQLFHEPGSTVLIAETAWSENNRRVTGARLSGFSGPCFGDGIPTWHSSVEAPRLFIVDCGSRDALARLFLDCALSVIKQHGEEGYAKLWDGRLPFPRRRLIALEAALATTPLSSKD